MHSIIKHRYLLAKYGPPGDFSRKDIVGGAGARYVFDQNGRPLPWDRYGTGPDPHVKDVCGIGISRGPVIYINGNDPTPLGFPEHMERGCHQMLSFGFGEDPKGFIIRLDVVEVNLDPIFAESEHWAEIKKRQVQKSQEDSKKIKTPL